jgi:hypothetical protein
VASPPRDVEPYIDGLRAHPVDLASHRDLHCSTIAPKRFDLPEAGRKVERESSRSAPALVAVARKALNWRRFEATRSKALPPYKSTMKSC